MEATKMIKYSILKAAESTVRDLNSGELWFLSGTKTFKISTNGSQDVRLEENRQN